MDTDITVMIVDDDISLRNLLKSIIVKIGYNVTEAANPVQAFETLKTMIPHLIILDMLMPVMDGASMLEKIRKIEGLKKVPVIICTSLSDKETVLKFASLGVHEFLLKPFETATAIQKIQKAITRHKHTTNGHQTHGGLRLPSDYTQTTPDTPKKDAFDHDNEITVDLSGMENGESPGQNSDVQPPRSEQ
ncbi:MAG TPA: response regulator [Patescibacteria group bacterium]|nr:response regulator [Patescibacteria group bacterium]